ncbi:MAG TPA: hypothetical protein VNW97_20445 [Candidatus Saccharimonadales bacterium]|nr:hypothetical protein [Candidatus Saccharimonadales bacterium]
MKQSALIPLLVLSLHTFLPALVRVPAPPLRTFASSAVKGFSGAEKSPLELKLAVVDRGGLFPCADGPPQELAAERERAKAEFPAMQKDSPEFRAVASYMGLERVTRFTADERLLVHCFYSKLQAVHLEPEGDKFKVTIDHGGRDATGTSGAAYIDRFGQMMIVESSTAQPSVSRPLREMNSQTGLSSLPPVAAEAPKLLEIGARLRLLRHYGRVASCNPMNPVRIGEGYDALEQRDPVAIAEIRGQLGIQDDVPLTEGQKQRVYSLYLDLRSIQLEKLVTGYYYVLALPPKAAGNTKARVEGILGAQGAIRVLRRMSIAGFCPK